MPSSENAARVGKRVVAECEGVCIRVRELVLCFVLQILAPLLKEPQAVEALSVRPMLWVARQMPHWHCKDDTLGQGCAVTEGVRVHSPAVEANCERSNVSTPYKDGPYLYHMSGRVPGVKYVCFF